MKSAEDLMKIRVKAYQTIEAMQLRIAIIDSKLMFDPRYRDQIEEADERVIEQMKPMAMLERNSAAPFN